MVNTVRRLQKRQQSRRYRVRNRVRRDATVSFRLSVFRSNRRIYAQVINDAEHVTVCAVCSGQGGGGTVAAAADVGTRIAVLAKAAGVDRVVFDRGSYKYHGRVAALAEAAREAGLII